MNTSVIPVGNKAMPRLLYLNSWMLIVILLMNCSAALAETLVDKGFLEENRNPLMTESELSFSNIKDLTWGEGQFVAVGRYGLIVTSPDGIAWTVRRTGRLHDTLTRVTWGNGLYISTGPRNTILSSHDGIAWRKHRVTIMSDKTIFDVAWVGNQFVAVGTGGLIITSQDGINWTRKTSDTKIRLVGIASGSGKIIVVGDSGTILSSPDGNEWTLTRTNEYIRHEDCMKRKLDCIEKLSQISGTTLFFDNIAWNGTHFVTVGKTRDTSSVGRSRNGDGWKANKWMGRFSNIEWIDGRFIVVGTDILISTDGLKWNSLNIKVPRLGYPLNLSLISGNKKIVIVIGSYGEVFFSHDGVKWMGGAEVSLKPAPSTTYIPDTLTLITSITEKAHDSQLKIALEGEDMWSMLYMIFVFFGVGLFVYVVLQIWSILKTSGVWRILASFPLIVAVIMFIVTMRWLKIGSEMVLIVTPLVNFILIVYLILLLALHSVYIKFRH